MTLDTALRHFPLLKQLPAHEGEPLIVAHGFDARARDTAAAAALGAARTALAFMLGQPGLGGAGLGLIVGRDQSATLRAGRRLGGPERLRHHAAALSALTAMGLGELAGALAREANAPSKVVRNRAESPVTRTMSDIALLKNMFFAGGFQGRSKFWKPIPPGFEKE